MALRFGLIALFVASVAGLRLLHPEALRSADAVFALVALGVLLAAFLIEHARASRHARPRDPEAPHSRAAALVQWERDRRRAAFARRGAIAMRTIATQIAVWCAIVVAATLVYANRAALQDQAATALSALRPGEAIAVSLLRRS